MRKCRAAVLAVLCGLSWLAYSAQTTQARLFCWSVRFQRGFDQGFSLDLSTLDLWTLSIDDLNDADQDGIPDFSDDPLTPARPPLLTLQPGATSLVLIISGDVGRSHLIQTNASLASTNWQLAQSITLATDPQTVSLPIPAGITFWRALVP